MSKTASVPSQTRTFIAGLDPLRLVTVLEENENPIDRRDGLYQAIRTRLLDDLGDPYVHLAGLFGHLDDFAVVEEVFRRAGFVVGFNVCRQLLLGELDLDALTKDENGSEGDTPEGGAR